MKPKPQIRDQILAMRLSLSRKPVEIASEVILDKLLDLKEVKKAGVVLVYMAINNEVDTHGLVERFIPQKKTVLVPAFDQITKSYVCTNFPGWEYLAEGPYRILEPERIMAVDPRLIELAILPGVAFDLKGTRLGYGKGVFDKLLSDTDCIKIGLAYDFQIIDDLPREDHDLVMDMVVTEKRIIKPSF